MTMSFPTWVLLFLNVQCLAAVHANWMYLGVVGVAPQVPVTEKAAQKNKDTCTTLPGLNKAQIELCSTFPDTMKAVSDGARRGIMECQYQFRNERWNCSTLHEKSVFGYTLQRGSRETAFIYAVTSAGVVHSVTQACSSGNLTECGCDLGKEGRETPQGWKWGGCSDNLRYGTHFAARFVDAPDSYKVEKSKSFRSFMNLHNNQAGRESISHLMRMQCRCHGVSGSCELKTCWRTMPTFGVVGDYLKEKYENAIQWPRGKKKRLKRKSRVKRRNQLEKTDLVHIHKSPNYCIEDPKKGIPGTMGRVCNKTSRLSDGCNLLCCGRGYNTRVVKHMERCQCKFLWCCSVKCKTCISEIDVHTCK